MRFMAGIVIGITIGSAGAAMSASQADYAFIKRIEMMFHIEPGRPVPANWQFPDIRLRYDWARPIGNDDYLIKVHRYR